jgi:DNA-binding beta-propeller fold protein YncE
MRSANMRVQWVMSLGALVVTTTLSAAQAPSPARLLVLLRDASALAIVDPVSRNVLGRVPTVKDPHEVTVSADGTTAFVASPSEGIAVIDLAAQKELRRVNPGDRSAPHDVLFAEGKVYFTAEGFKSIGRYDPAANKVEWMLGIGQDGTHMLVLSKDRNTMYVPNRGSNSVSVIEAIATGPPKWRVAAIPVPGKTPEGIDLSPDGRELWTATRGDGGISIIDVASRKVTQTLSLGLTDANRLKLTPDGRLALILDGGTGSLIVLDAPGRKEIKRIKLAPGDTGDGGMMVMRDSSRVYLGLRDAHKVSVVDLKTLEVTNEIAMGAGSGPGCIAWVP